jgi:hypothetical protein
MTTWALTIQAIGFVLKYTVPTCPWVLGGVLVELGWVGMVSGFSIVLYSRLNLLVQKRRVLRFVLAMIIVDGVCLHTSTIVVQFCYSARSNDDPQKRAPWIAASNTIERVQAVWFTFQQLIISCLYIKAAWNHLQDRMFPNQRTRKIMILLIAVQLLVLIIDIIVVVLECAGYFVVKLLIHSFIYSIKLELEFVILNQLIAISRLGVDDLMSVPPDLEPYLPDLNTTAPALPIAIGYNEKSGRASPQLNPDLLGACICTPGRKIPEDDSVLRTSQPGERTSGAGGSEMQITKESEGQPRNEESNQSILD